MKPRYTENDPFHVAVGIEMGDDFLEKCREVYDAMSHLPEDGLQVVQYRGCCSPVTVVEGFKDPYEHLDEEDADGFTSFEVIEVDSSVIDGFDTPRLAWCTLNVMATASVFWTFAFEVGQGLPAMTEYETSCISISRHRAKLKQMTSNNEGRST